jgi:hypothetical protein
MIFFAPAACDLPQELMPKAVSRALVSDFEICLMDGVDLHVESVKAKALTRISARCRFAGEWAPVTRKRN